MAQIFRIARGGLRAALGWSVGERKTALALAAALMIGAPLVGKVAHSADVEATEFDYTIIPGERIGPIRLDTPVRDIIKMLGRPDGVRRSTYRDEHNDADLITYRFKRYCLYVTWFDKGLWPLPESRKPVNPPSETDWKKMNLPAPAIVATCPMWKTKLGGVAVGSSPDEVVSGMRYPDRVDNCKTDRRECILIYESGLWLWTRDRNSPVFQIGLVKKITAN